MAMTYLTKLKPEPMGAHSLATAYGVNSLVMSGDGAAAYISVKDVPAGTPLTNTEYWKIHTDLTAVRQSADAAAQRANAARDEMLEIARNLTDMVEKSGNPVQAELVGGLPFDRVETMLEPIQSGSGDPSPSNIRIISGWKGAKLTRCGKNLLNATLETQTINGVTITNNGDGTYTLNGTATENFTVYVDHDKKVPLSAYGIERGKQYKLVGCPAGGLEWQTYQLYLNVTGNGSNYTDIGNGIVFTPTDEDMNSTYNVGISVMKGVNCNNLVFRPMLTDDLTTTYNDFVQYRGNTYTTDFGQTVYGGTLDWQTGVLTVDKAFVEYDGSADENWLTQTTATSGYRRFRIVPGNAEPNTGAGNVAYVVSNMYKATSPNGTYSKTTGICVNQNELMIYDADRATLTVDEWKAWLSEHPVQIAYKLATPTTIQLTPQEIKQIQGVNTLYGDGSISMTGRADKALELEARIAALEAAG